MTLLLLLFGLLATKVHYALILLNFFAILSLSSS